MVRLRWTFALIIISVTLLTTVITAFRIRDFQKTSHERVSEFKKKQKCEDCDMNKPDLHQKLHLNKDESGKRSYVDLKNTAQEKKQSIDEKTFIEETNEISDEEEDEGDENLIYLKQLASKWQEKQIASGVVIEVDAKPLSSSKKNSFTTSEENIIQNREIKKHGSDHAADDDDDDDDEINKLKIKSILVPKKESLSSLNNKISEGKQLKSLKYLNENEEKKDNEDKKNNEDEEDNDNDESEEDDDNDDDHGNDKKVEMSNKVKIQETKKAEKTVNLIKPTKTVTKEKLYRTTETTEAVEATNFAKTSDLKIKQTSIKSDIENQQSKSRNEDTIKKENKLVRVQNPKQILQKDLSDKNTAQDGINKEESYLHSKDIKISGAKKIKDNTRVRIKSQPKLGTKHTIEDVGVKSKTISKEIYDESQENHKNESREQNRLRLVTDALHRRNLLQSEFEDFYAFFPTFAPNFTRVKNPECRRHGQILLRQLRGTKLWALNMLDATGKIPSGILQGNGIQLGNFDQCLESRARVQLDTGSVVKVQGKYCLARIDLKAEHPELAVPVYLAQAKNLIKSRIDDPGHFVPRFSTLSWGICVPSACDSEDVENIIRDAIKHYQYTSGISIRVKVDRQDCHMEKKQAWWEDWLGIPTLLTLSLYAVVVLLVLVASAQDFFASGKSEESSIDATDENAECDQKDTKNNKSADVKQRSVDSVISAFSLYRTVSKLVAPATSDEIACIHGVRAIATIALLVAHKFLPVAAMPYTNRVKLSEVVSSPLWSWCRAGWMYTDCFLLLSGALTAHRISSDSDSGAFKRILSRYLRLTPALLAVLLFYAFIWDNISIGPLWGALVTKNAEVCQEGWWWNILYVQNYFGFEDMCAPQTHQLALDMQLSILGGVVLWAMQSDLPVLKAILPTLHVWTAFSRYKTAREHRLTMLAYHGVSVSQLYRTARLSYTSVIHRSTPYLIGLSLGLALNTNTRHSKILLALGWLASGLLWSVVWWAGYDSGSTQYQYSATFAAQYSALAPISSALAIAWLIYAVHGGHCDFLHRVLCTRPLALISRLSYALYLCQFIVFLTNAATVRNSREFSLMSLIDIQEISLILLSSLLLTLTFVIPMQSLPRVLFLMSTTKNQENKKAEVSDSKKVQEQLEKSMKIVKVSEYPLVRNRQTLIAHREVLEEIPEVETEYENRRQTNDALDEILEEEEDGSIDEGRKRLDEEDLEIIEEEQGDDEEDFWRDREDNAQRRSLSRNSDRDLDDWELTGNENGRSGAQYYQYSRER